MLSRTWIIKTQIHAVTVRGVCLPATWLGLSQRWNISRLFYGFCRTVEPQEHSPVLPASSTPPPASSSSLEFLGSFLLPPHLLCHLLSLLLFPKNCWKENQALHLVLGREPKTNKKKIHLHLMSQRHRQTFFLLSLWLLSNGDFGWDLSLVGFWTMTQQILRASEVVFVAGGTHREFSGENCCRVCCQKIWNIPHSGQTNTKNTLLHRESSENDYGAEGEQCFSRISWWWSHKVTERIQLRTIWDSSRGSSQ